MVMIKMSTLLKQTSIFLLFYFFTSVGVCASVGEIGQIKGSGVLEREGKIVIDGDVGVNVRSMDEACLLYTSPSPRD